MSVLVDTSVWVDYFRSGNNSEKLDFLIDEIFTTGLVQESLIIDDGRIRKDPKK